MFDRMPPVHPGEILSEDFLKPMALSPGLSLPWPRECRRVVYRRLLRDVAASLLIRQFAWLHFLVTRLQFWLN